MISSTLVCVSFLRNSAQHANKRDVPTGPGHERQEEAAVAIPAQPLGWRARSARQVTSPDSQSSLSAPSRVGGGGRGNGLRLVGLKDTDPSLRGQH